MRSLTYNGPSMHPILRPGDLLFVVPYEGQKVRRGDVIVFIPPRDDGKVVHRIIFVDSQGIKTRGDNNNQVDSWILSPDDVIGRVAFVQRGNRYRKALGGKMGLALSWVVRAFKMIDSRVSPILRPVYNCVSGHDCLRRCVPRSWAPRVITLDRPEGSELLLLMGRHVIGRKLPGRGRWHIRRPFRLVVDEGSLPQS